MPIVRKLQNNKYEVRYNKDPHPTTGKRRQGCKRFNRRKDADAFLRDLIKRDYYEPDTPYTVKEFMEYWLETFKKNDVELSSYEGYRNIINKHIIPHMGAKLITDIKPMFIQEFYNHMAKTYARRTIKYVHTTLQQAFKKAMLMRLIDYNPVLSATVPKRTKDAVRPKVLSTEQVKTLLNALEGHYAYTPVLLAVSLALRRGEALGLRWEDIDFANRIVHIQNNRVCVDRHGVVEKATKNTSSDRLLIMPEHLIEKLLMQKQRYEWIAKKFPVRKNDYVCKYDDGQPLNPNSFSKQFRNVIQSLDIPQIRFHDLRHTCVTLLAKAGIPREIIMLIAGHATQAMNEHYTHFGIEQQQAAVTVIDEVLK